jgi:hypothetical protein
MTLLLFYQQALLSCAYTVLILPSIEQEIAELPIDFMGDRRIVPPQRRKQKAYACRLNSLRAIKFQP